MTALENSLPLISLEAFRAQFELPDTFGVAEFEPKNWVGLGSMDGAGQGLKRVEQAVLNMLPGQVSPAHLLDLGDGLSTRFYQELKIANQEIGLSPVEVEFAVAGFKDVLQGISYQLIQQYKLPGDPLQNLSEAFDVEKIYQDWMQANTQVSGTTHTYPHGDRVFACRVMYDPYGRLGLLVEVEGLTFHVLDTSLACPAANFMHRLLTQVGNRIYRGLLLALQQNPSPPREA